MFFVSKHAATFHKKRSACDLLWNVSEDKIKTTGSYRQLAAMRHIGNWRTYSPIEKVYP